MFRATRTAVVAVLAFAIAALPAVIDRCAESCDAHQHTVASTPACHHAASTGAHVSQVPAPCGHDHNGTAVTAATSPAPTGRAFDSIAMVDHRQTVAPPAASDRRVRPYSPPDSPTALAHRSLPLRV